MQLKLNRPLVVFDLETTGINVGTDRIVEICMLKLFPDGREEIKTIRMNPSIPIPPVVTAIHGISDEDVKGLPEFPHFASEISNFIAGSDLSGYNAIKFDIPLLAEELLRAGYDFEMSSRRIIDVQNIFHKMEPRTLRAAYKFYCRKDHINAHSAEADTIATYEILKSQLDLYENRPFEEKDGRITHPVVNDVEQLHKFSFVTRNVDLAGHIVVDEKNREVFNFGKYKGEPVEWVFGKEPSYYDWMMKAQFPLYTKKVITAIKLRGFNQGSSQVLKK